MYDSLKGKVVIVTGGASGIGLATAKAFRRKGARVVIADIVPLASIEPHVRRWLASSRAKKYVEADLSKAGDCVNVVIRTIEKFDGVDILVNNVGIQPLDSYKRVEDLDGQMLYHMFAANLFSYFYMSKYAIPEIRRRGGGAIVNVASVQGLLSMPLVAAYSASKAGVIGLTRTMALDHVREGIRVNAVCPGTTDTAMVRAAAAAETPEGGDIEATIRGYGTHLPGGRVGKPEEVAAAILFLASEDASMISGAVLPVDDAATVQGAWAHGTGAQIR